MQVETSRNTHLKGDGNLEQVRQSKMLMKGILELRRKIPSEKMKHQILTSKFGKGKNSERQFSIADRNPNRGTTEDAQMHHRMIKGLQS